MGESYRHRQPTSVRTLWVGGLQHWVDENFLSGCFAHTGEVQSVRLIRNKLSGHPEGYGFIEFISHEAAEKVLQTYNGAQMPGTGHTFRLNWASFRSGEKHPHEGSDHSNGSYPSVRPMPISAEVTKPSSRTWPQDQAAKDIWRASDSLLEPSIIVGSLICPVVDPVSTPPGLTAGFSPPLLTVELHEIKLGTLQCPIKELISLPLKIGSVQPTVLVESKKKKNKRWKKKKRTGSPSPTTDSTSSTDSHSSDVGSSAPPWEAYLPVWSVPWSGLPCGCPLPVSAWDTLNMQPTLYVHNLPDEPNEILASFKPWVQRFYGYGGIIPCPHDLVPLEVFKEKCPFSEPYVLYNGKEIEVTTSSGRFVLVGSVEDVLCAFKSGFSWGGNFSKEDLAVQIGVRCYISKVPNLPGTYENLCKDLDQLAETLIPYFRGEHTNKIAFIEHLYNTLKNPPSPSSTLKERMRYLKFLKRHPAHADPLSISSLLVGVELRGAHLGGVHGAGGCGLGFCLVSFLSSNTFLF